MSPLLYVLTDDEHRAIMGIERLSQRQSNKFTTEVFIYKSTTGIIPLQAYKHDIDEKKGVNNTATMEINNALIQIYQADKKDRRQIYIITEADHHLEDPQIVRRFKDFVIQADNSDSNLKIVVLLSSKLNLPSKLEKYVDVFTYPYPSEEEIKEEITTWVAKFNDAIKDKKKQVELCTDFEIVNALKGLIIPQIHQMITACIDITRKDSQNSGRGKLDPGIINALKREVINKTSLLKFKESTVSFKDVGGLGRLKKWFKKMHGGWTNEGQKFGLPIVKGCLLIGLPGCGKSLICEALASEWNLNLVEFDPSKVFSSRVGESEGNMHLALARIESLAPCLTEDAKITLADGQVATIKELHENNYRQNVISFDDEFKITTSTVKLITKKQSNDVFNVVTNIGDIKATSNHMFPVLVTDGNLQWKTVSQLSNDDFIVCPRQIKTSKTINLIEYFDKDTRFYSEKLHKDLLSLLDKKLLKGRQITQNYVYQWQIIKYKLDISTANDITKIVEGLGGYTDSSINKIPNNFSEDFAYILGLLWSDGNLGNKNYWKYDSATFEMTRNRMTRVRNKNKTRFYNKEQALHNELITFLKDNFDADLCRTNDKFVTYGIPLILAKVMRRIQKDLLTVDEKFQWAWLSGVLDGDGCVFRNKVNYTAAKFENNECLRNMLLRVGIITPEYGKRYKSNHNCPINITSNFLTLFKTKINSRHPKKKSILKTLDGRHNGECSRFDTMNVKQNLINLLLEKQLINEDWKRQSFYKSISSIVKSKRKLQFYLDLKHNHNISTTKIRQIFQELQQDKSLPWFLSDDYFFAKVESKQKLKGNHDVYDLCLDKHHNFIANKMFTHNCILFIDEIEKGFAGMQSSSFSDAGTTARTIGIFLIWMNNNNSWVFSVSTCNQIHILPPELVSRYDSVFYVGPPDPTERKEIIAIQIKNNKRDPAKFDLDLLAGEASNHLAGREIKHAVNEAMYDAFEMYKVDGKTDLNTEILKHALSIKIPITKTMEKQLEHLVKWVGFDKERREGIRARFANNDMDEIDALFNEVLSNVKEESQNVGFGPEEPQL
jgi:intein/homing endonuclease/AAA+ superfamily predicted ATPase